MDTDIGQLDREFAADVLGYLRATRQQAKTRLLPDDMAATDVMPRSSTYKRRHEAPAQIATINKAEAKRLRKMERNK